MSTDIDFSALTLKDALDLAILIEDEAQGRYEEFASQMELHHTPEAAKFFVFMAGNEAKHGTELRERRQKLFADQPTNVSPEQLYDVEAPEYDQAAAFMSPRQALEVAYRAEVKAFDFFDKALPHVSNAEVQELFTELREEEVEHQQMVKAELAKLPPEPGFDPDDFVDEPVAQG
ncbi:MAG: ferritin family protein [Acidobacteria bacterium]|jgi:erythrin-vacuolar iron transport family protein|nr:ferritin family protein [Acidobacteriota bacterium]